MIGQTISQYKILEKLGEGGMGVVYKATDTKLNRFVALKFLPPHMAASEQDKARFIQEAQSAAALNHPNVCSIIDIQEYDSQMFIVMEFVDGQTLQEKRSSLSLKQTIDYAIQIAEGLSAAHEKGIIHRDIKPENIMIRKDGIVQVMDFGLAKLVGVSRLTKAGSTVGTLGYMSPEQVQGQETDHRSDIFSFGVLLYEMLTGKSPFSGAHESAILYEIVNVDVAPPSTVKPETDTELDRIVLECMEKDPNERMQSIKQVAIDLNRFKRTSSRTRMSRSFSTRSAVAQPASQMPVEPDRFQWKKIVAWIAAALCVIIMIVAFILRPAAEQSFQSPLNVSIILPDSIKPLFFGGGSPPLISPDGKHVAYIDANGRQIVVYSLEERRSIRLRKTEGASHPFWSPDGKNIGFFSQNKVKRTDLVSGSPVTVCITRNPRGGSWNQFGQIIFTDDYQAPIVMVSAEGGEPVPVTVLDTARREGSHRFPSFLPDGKHFLYLVRTTSESGEAEGDAIYVGSLDGSVKKMIVRSSANAMYANGHLVYTQNRTILAQAFDPDSWELSGDPVVLENDVINDVTWNLAMFSVSANGILISQPGKLLSGAPVLIYSPEGKQIASVGGLDEQGTPAFSPDGKELAVWLYEIKSRRTNIWIYDLRTGTKTRVRFTNGKDGEFNPIWSPDGNRIICSYRFMNGALYEKQTKNFTEAKQYFHSDENLRPMDWSRDGKRVLVQKLNTSLNNSDLYWIDDAKRDSLHPIVVTAFDEVDGRFSPDGDFVSYRSNETGEFDLYLLSLKNGQSWKVDDNVVGGPRWGRSSSELYYVKRGRIMTRATIAFGKEEVSSIIKKELFAAPLTSLGFDVSRDGSKIAFVRAFEAEEMKYPPVSMKLFWNTAK
jgi:serine/threonine protein kinase